MLTNCHSVNHFKSQSLALKDWPRSVRFYRLAVKTFRSLQNSVPNVASFNFDGPRNDICFVDLILVCVFHMYILPCFWAMSSVKTKEFPPQAWHLMPQNAQHNRSTRHAMPIVVGFGRVIIFTSGHELLFVCHRLATRSRAASSGVSLRCVSSDVRLKRLPSVRRR